MEKPGLISVRVQRAEQLFQRLDPNPFTERDLSPETESYIVDFARELPSSLPLRVTVRMAENEGGGQPAIEIGDAIRNYFGGRADALNRELKELFRLGRRAAGVGILVLAACIAADQLLLPAIGWDNRFVAESLVILGWVANWKPLEIFLYDWWPVVSRRRLYRRLAQADVVIEPEVPEAAAIARADG
jgi:hypothetical protein